MVNPMVNRVKVYWGKTVLRVKDRVKLGTDNIVAEYHSVFHRGDSLLEDVTSS